MLSGHVRKGDTIEIPCPYPEAWAETVGWIYTGKEVVGEKARENLEYLGGRVGEVQGF